MTLEDIRFCSDWCVLVHYHHGLGVATLRNFEVYQLRVKNNGFVFISSPLALQAEILIAPENYHRLHIADCLQNSSTYRIILRRLAENYDDV